MRAADVARRRRRGARRRRLALEAGAASSQSSASGDPGRRAPRGRRCRRRARRRAPPTARPRGAPSGWPGGPRWAAPGLDRVGEDHRRAVGRRRPGGRRRAGRRGRGRRGRAARPSLGVGDVAEQPPIARRRDPRPGGARAAARSGAQQPLVLLVAHPVDAPPQRLAAVALEELAQAAPVLDRDRLPAGGLEHRPDRPAAMSGTIRSSDWRLRSTTHITSPRRGTIGSTSASQIAPSSSSASPTRATWRPPRGTSKWPAT